MSSKANVHIDSEAEVHAPDTPPVDFKQLQNRPRRDAVASRLPIYAIQGLPQCRVFSAE